MKLYILCFFILLFSACGIDKEAAAPPLSSTNNSGELDITFDGNGYYTLNGSAGGGGNDQINDLVIDSQDRVIAVGSSVNASGNLDMTVWRLNSDGVLDSTFSGDGIFSHHSAAGGAGNDIAYSVATNSSNEIFVTGTSLNGSGDFDMVVWKIKANGTLDTSFSGTGVFTDDSAAGGSLHDQGTGIHVDSSGNVFVTGYSDQTVTNRDMALWKLSASGVLDPTFSGDGVFTHDSAAGGEDDNGNAILTDSSGNVYVVGRSDSVGNLGDMAVWKLTPTGILDVSFNGSGIFTHNGAAGFSGFDSATDFVLDSSGKLVITGYSRNSAGDNDTVIWRLLSSGSLDTTFDADGFLNVDVSAFVGGVRNDSGEAIMIDSNDRYVVVGSGNDDMYIWRFETNGNLDTEFNTDGVFSHDSAAGGFAIDTGLAVGEDSLNRLYIGGFSENGAGDFDATFWRMK